ncbi:MAG: SDR family oxidoreductase [Sandaracinaceae bacterium]|nr:SDR family oxidoreductase [Sandaracinaceae bacterium]
MGEGRKLAVVTGASSGIGAELARELAARGYDCVLSARRVSRLEELAAELREGRGIEVHVITADLSTREGAAELFEGVTALGRPVGFLANNAGFGIYGRFVEQPVERIEEMIQLNVTSLTTLTRLFVAPMVRQGHGRVLQVASIGAFQPSPLYAVYSATKAYVRDFSQALHFELRGTGVTVTTMCPGLTESEFHEKADHLKPKYMDTLMMKRAPRGRDRGAGRRARQERGHARAHQQADGVVGRVDAARRGHLGGGRVHAREARAGAARRDHEDEGRRGRRGLRRRAHPPR